MKSPFHADAEFPATKPMSAYDVGQFPRARMPTLPVVSLHTFGLRTSVPPVGVIWMRNALKTYSGRSAIALALAHARLRKGACFGEAAGLPVGSIGDYAVASTLKFFPIGDGGLLASAHRDLSDIQLRPPPLKVELKAAVNFLEQRLEYRRLGRAGRIIAGLLGPRERFLRHLKRMRQTSPEPVANATAQTPESAVDPRWLAWSGTRVSAFLLRHARTADLARRRRDYSIAYLGLATPPNRPSSTHTA